MESLHQPKSEALRALFWRDEILQLVFWLQGEGLGDAVDAALLERFLGVEAEIGGRYLERLVDEGLLARGPTGYYELTAEGRLHGGRIFAQEFGELTQPAHGECGPECWCHASPDEAEACLAERQGGSGRSG